MKKFIFNMFLCAFVLMGSTAYSEHPAAPETVCEVTGIVADVRQVASTPWHDGAPSALAEVETQIYVGIQDRRPHDKNATADNPCHKETKGEMRVYKLCSPTQARKGDRIHGTEGMRTGLNNAHGCLFDLVVLPKAG